MAPEGDASPTMNHRLLKLSPGYYILWLILWLVIASKVYLIRSVAPADLYELALFGPALLVLSYGGAWAIWRSTGKVQRTGEIAYLAIITILFLARTVFLYREALAGR